MKTKTCPKCGFEKSFDEFAKNKTKNDGLSFYCKICQREYVRNHYKKNTNYYKNKARKRQSFINEWYRKFKSSLICEICGEDHIACIEFHHKDPNEKEESLSKAVNKGWGIERLEKEIKKCQVLCSNCHHKTHYEERSGPFKYMPDECDGST